MTQPDLRSIGARFALEGEYQGGVPYGSGHINDTFLIEYAAGAGNRRYILQRLNSRVFPNVEELMSNVERVLEHQQKKKADAPAESLTPLALVRSKDSRSYVIDDEGAYWRTYEFVEGARSFDTIPSTAHARSAARAFGEFQGQLADLPPPRLHETIPDFHNTPARFRQLKEAIERDTEGRAESCRAEIDFALERESITSTIELLMKNGEIPDRVAHNDAKLNNVLLDERTGRGVCVIDIDTVMSGTILYDYGDMVRSTTMPVAEDDTDLHEVPMNMEMFEAVTQGYLSETVDWLTEVELEHLAVAGQLTTLEVGFRFLTDFLQGDSYFKTSRPLQNLERCRTQFALVASIEQHFARLQEIVAKEVNRVRDRS